MDWNGIEWEKMRQGEAIWNETGSGEQNSMERKWVETRWPCIAIKEWHFSVSSTSFFFRVSEHNCSEHLGSLCVLHNLIIVLTETYCCHQGIYAASLMSPFCGGFMTLLSNLISAVFHLPQSLSLSQTHKEWERAWGPLCWAAVSCLWDGSKLGLSN